jgi:hypothetical protein
MGHDKEENGRGVDIEEEAEGIEEREPHLYIPLTMRQRIILLGLLLMIVLTFYTSATIEYLVGTAPPPAEEPPYQLVFIDDFEAGLDLGDQWTRRIRSVGTVSARNGSVFLNITKTTQGSFAESVLLYPTYGNEWLYTTLDMRLRCSDDNKLQSDVGGGMKLWGLSDGTEPPHNGLYFRSLSPESHPDIVGFYAGALVNDTDTYQEKITDVDITQWHNYTITWNRDNATFLIDNQVVGQTSEVPISRTQIMVMLGSSMLGNRTSMLKVGGYYWSDIDLDHDTSIEIDHVKITANKTQFDDWNQKITHNFTETKELIRQAEMVGINTTRARGIYSQAQDSWKNRTYLFQTTRTHLQTIHNTLNPAIENLDKIRQMFSQAEAKAANAEPADKGALDTLLRRAREAWDKPDYQTTKTYLEEILQAQPRA